LNHHPAADITSETPAEVTAVLGEIDEFIEREIEPLEREGDNARFFDHRREIARTDFEAGGIGPIGPGCCASLCRPSWVGGGPPI
jgi:hypothetical protein